MVFRGLALVGAMVVAVPASAQAVDGAVPASAQPIEDAAPVAPAVLAASYATPAKDADGYRTPNRGLTGHEAVWHARVALNVAALGCRGEKAAAMVAAYNAMLDRAKAPLAEAQAGTEAAVRGRAGAAWQARYDDEMTKLYNYFAQTPAHDGFCAAAADLLVQSGNVEPSDFAAFAAAALPVLEAPFTGFYAAWDKYKADAAAWAARHPVVIATVAAAPVVQVAAVQTAR